MKLFGLLIAFALFAPRGAQAKDEDLCQYLPAGATSLDRRLGSGSGIEARGSVVQSGCGASYPDGTSAMIMRYPSGLQSGVDFLGMRDYHDSYGGVNARNLPGLGEDSFSVYKRSDAAGKSTYQVWSREGCYLFVAASGTGEEDPPFYVGAAPDQAAILGRAAGLRARIGELPRCPDAPRRGLPSGVVIVGAAVAAGAAARALQKRRRKKPPAKAAPPKAAPPPKPPPPPPVREEPKPPLVRPREDLPPPSGPDDEVPGPGGFLEPNPRSPRTAWFREHGFIWDPRGQEWRYPTSEERPSEGEVQTVGPTDTQQRVSRDRIPGACLQIYDLLVRSEARVEQFRAGVELTTSELERLERLHEVRRAAAIVRLGAEAWAVFEGGLRGALEARKAMRQSRDAGLGVKEHWKPGSEEGLPPGKLAPPRPSVEKARRALEASRGQVAKLRDQVLELRKMIDDAKARVSVWVEEAELKARRLRNEVEVLDEVAADARRLAQLEEREAAIEALVKKELKRLEALSDERAKVVARVKLDTAEAVARATREGDAAIEAARVARDQAIENARGANAAAVEAAEARLTGLGERLRQLEAMARYDESLAPQVGQLRAELEAAQRERSALAERIYAARKQGDEAIRAAEQSKANLIRQAESRGERFSENAAREAQLEYEAQDKSTRDLIDSMYRAGAAKREAQALVDKQRGFRTSRLPALREELESAEAEVARRRQVQGTPENPAVARARDLEQQLGAKEQSLNLAENEVEQNQLAADNLEKATAGVAVTGGASQAAASPQEPSLGKRVKGRLGIDHAEEAMGAMASGIAWVGEKLVGLPPSYQEVVDRLLQDAQEIEELKHMIAEQNRQVDAEMRTCLDRREALKKCIEEHTFWSPPAELPS